MFRFDRFITLHVNPYVSGVGESQTPYLPILMYHSISEKPDGGQSYYRTVTSPHRFADQMRILKENGFRGVTLRDGLAWIQSVGSNGHRTSRLGDLTSVQPVVLTFDDGFRDFYTAAMPILREFDFRATMFLSTASITDGDPRRQFLSRECLTWSEVRELHATGIDFGSHTVNHPKLTDLTWIEIKSELSASKSQIERELGTTVSAFAYPYAFPQADLHFAVRFGELLHHAGYTSCVTTEIGRTAVGDDPFRLKRIPINDADDEELFAAKINGAYDWLAFPQRIIKALKHPFDRHLPSVV